MYTYTSLASYQWVGSMSKYTCITSEVHRIRIDFVHQCQLCLHEHFDYPFWWSVKYMYTVEPRLSESRLSESSIIRMLEHSAIWACAVGNCPRGWQKASFWLSEYFTYPNGPGDKGVRITEAQLYTNAALKLYYYIYMKLYYYQILVITVIVRLV